MARDVFQRTNDTFGGSFAADGATVTFPEFGLLNANNSADVNSPGTGLLVQNLSSQYNQMITKIYEVGSPNIYYIGGRTQGNLGLSRILGPRPIQLGFYEKFSDVCDAATNQMNISLLSRCPTQDVADQNQNFNRGETTIYNHKFCVIMGLSMAINSQDSIINEQSQVMFGALNLSQGRSPLSLAVGAVVGGLGGLGV